MVRAAHRPGVGAEVDDEAVRRFLALATERGRIARGVGAREVLERLHLVRGDRLDIAGALLLARGPQGPLPQAVVRALARRGAVEYARSIEGPLLRQRRTLPSNLASLSRTATFSLCFSPIRLRPVACAELNSATTAGVPDHIKRAVTENATQLGFKSKGWE